MNAKENGTVIISTDFGDIEVLLHDDTPLHKANFLKLAKDGYYDETIFHRIIKDFMIQGGEQLSQNDVEEVRIPAEFVYPKYYHRKGALAAARQGDNMNPEKASSSTQFYIVTGRKFTDAELDTMEKQRFESLKQALFSELKLGNNDLIKELYRSGEKAKLAELRESMITEATRLAIDCKSEAFFTDQQRNDYLTVGGAPHLDGEYTIFGEVINGMDVVDKIQSVPTSRSDRPISDVKMQVKF